MCALFKAYTGGRAWKAIRPDVGKYSFLNRTIKSWNQLPADLLASFPFKLNTFRDRVKNIVTSRGNSSEVC
jgi:hypothetical protein